MGEQSAVSDEFVKALDEIWKEARKEARKEVETAKAEARKVKEEARKEMVEIAKNLLVYGMTVRKTAEVTGLYVAVVVGLRNGMRREKG